MQMLMLGARSWKWSRSSSCLCTESLAGASCTALGPLDGSVRRILQMGSGLNTLDINSDLGTADMN